MIFEDLNAMKEAEEITDIDILVKDPNTAEGQEAIADEIESNMKSCALENMTYFENGEQALKEFCNSEEVAAMLEARKMSKRTFVRLGKNDDLTRRRNMACLILARENKDPLFDKLAQNRVKERKIRNAIYARYGAKAERIAKLSQKKHIVDMKKMPSMPSFNPNR